MESMTTNENLLSQDDVDAILSQSGLEGSYAEKDDTPSPSPEKKAVATKPRTQEEARTLSYKLYDKAFLEREKGVSVIWNAAEIMPMESGLNIKIQGKDYLTLGVLNERHIIIGCTG